MIVLLAVAICTGVATAVILMPFGALTALAIAPVVASLSAALAGFLLAWRTIRHDRTRRDLEAQTKVMVATLRNAAQRTSKTSPAPKVSEHRRKA